MRNDGDDNIDIGKGLVSSGASGGLVIEEQGIRLNDLDFTDLLISQDGEALIKGSAKSDGKLNAVPDAMITDLHEVLEYILKIYPRHEDEDSFSLEWGEIIYRVTAIEDIDGVWFTLRKPMGKVPRINQLGGFNMPMVRHLSWIGRENGSGLVLIAGKTGNGKTTTAYTLLREYLKFFGGLAVTIEDPPEMRFEHGDFPFGRCLQLRRKSGHTFADYFRKMLRMTPRFIFIGELRRGSEASDALRLANSGHVVITTIHAGSVVEAVNSFIKLASSEGVSETFTRDLFAQAVAAIIHQEIELKKSPVPGEGYRKRLKLETYFFGNDEGARTMIREGKQNQLNSSIDRQKSLMENGYDPVDISGKKRPAGAQGTGQVKK
jgi:twitching motility protein PilT